MESLFIILNIMLSPYEMPIALAVGKIVSSHAHDFIGEQNFVKAELLLSNLSTFSGGICVTYWPTSPIDIIYIQYLYIYDTAISQVQVFVKLLIDLVNSAGWV